MQNLLIPGVYLTNLTQWQSYYISFVERISALYQASKISSTEHKMVTAYLDNLNQALKYYFSLKTLPKQTELLQSLLDELQIFMAEKKFIAVTNFLTELQTILIATRNHLLEPMAVEKVPPEILNHLASDNFSSRAALNLAQCSRLFFFGDSGLSFLAKCKRLSKLEKFKFTTNGNDCFLLINNQLFVWGSISYGMLGLGDNSVRNIPVEFNLTLLQLAPGDGVAQVVLGGDHTILLTQQNRCFVWGGNQEGQLGLGDNNDRNAAPHELDLTPLGLTLQDDLAQVVAGRYYTLLRTQQGRCFAWGNNRFGQLGFGDDVDRNAPDELDLTPLRLAAEDGVAQIVAGPSHSFLLTHQGRCFVWGDNQHGKLGLGDEVEKNSPVEFNLARLQLALGDSVAQIMAGDDHSILLTRKGRCFVWGGNQHGQLGLGDDFGDRKAPVELNLALLQLAPGDSVAQIMAGDDHSILLTRRGRCFVWGGNQHGQLGLGDKLNRHSPVELNLARLKLAPGDSVAQITAGSFYSSLFTRQGRCFVWGWNIYGQLGLGYDSGSVPTPTEATYPHLRELKNLWSSLQNEELASLASLACAETMHGQTAYQLIVNRLALEKIQTRLSVISLIHASPWHQLPQVTELLPFASLYYPLIEALGTKPNKEQQYIATALAKLLDVYHYFLNATTSSEQTHQEDFIELLKAFSLGSLKDNDDFDKYLEETASRYLKNFGLTVLGCSVDSAVPNLATRFIDMCQELLTAAKQQPELLSHLKTAADILLQGLNAATEVDGLAHTLRALLQPKEQLRPTRPGAGLSS